MAQKTGLKVLHAMPGRVRLGVTGGSKTDAYLLSDQLDALAQRLQQQEGIRNVSANAKTGSLTVNFDQTTLSLSRLLERLQHWGYWQVLRYLPNNRNKIFHSCSRVNFGKSN